MKSPSSNPRLGDDDSPIQGRNWLSGWIEGVIAALTPKCAQVIQIISESLDRPIGARTRLMLRAHYLVCCYCRRYEKQMHRLRRFTIALPEHLDESMPNRLDEAVKDKIKQCLREVNR